MTAEELLAPFPPRIVALAERLRCLVRATLPGATERVYPGWRGVGYRHPQAGYFGAIFPFADRVALAFELGVLLDDPEHLLRRGRTGGKKVRYLEVRSGRDVRVGAIRSLLRQAIALKDRRVRQPRTGRADSGRSTASVSGSSGAARRGRGR